MAIHAMTYHLWMFLVPKQHMNFFQEFHKQFPRKRSKKNEIAEENISPLTLLQKGHASYWYSTTVFGANSGGGGSFATASLSKRAVEKENTPANPSHFDLEDPDGEPYEDVWNLWIDAMEEPRMMVSSAADAGAREKREIKR